MLDTASGERPDPARPAPPEPHRGLLGRKLGAIFLLLALLLLAVLSVVVANLRQVLADGRRFMEETREARLAQDLLTTLGQIDLLARLGPAATAGDREGIQEMTRDLLSRAGRTLGTLASGPGEADPSRHEHQATEDAMFRRLEADLAAIDRDLEHRGTETVQPELRRLLNAVEEFAADLQRETAEEAFLAAQDLETRVQGLVWVMVFCVAASLAVLLLVFWLVRRSILAPILQLRRGTRLFGSGRLDHRIQVRSSDELGELARDFNRMAQSLRQTQEELEERVRERTREFIQAAKLAGLGTFAAGVAHEVNTPLASIASSAEGLERRLSRGSVERDEEMDYLRTIAREAYRAHEITDRLLAFARQKPAPMEALDLATRVREVERMVRHQAERRGVRLEVEVAPDLPAVRANASEMQQVLLNLVTNALHASPADGTVRLHCRGRNGEVMLEVCDQGAGVPAADRERIFDPFFTTKEPGQGTGLGLSLAYRIVEGHGGRIQVDDAPGGGARFRVFLPPAAAAREARA